jgi:hypothetical protein
MLSVSFSNVKNCLFPGDSDSCVTARRGLRMSDEVELHHQNESHFALAIGATRALTTRMQCHTISWMPVSSSGARNSN